ncbi:glycosyltransferase family 2 protein [Arenicella sp. 4NH20-0111]|uniref:glycosyltransferase n=1 Tax=Arenicella sp. 4NH20-0111 TaxID=3127648 RepID=UPI003102382F
MTKPGTQSSKSPQSICFIVATLNCEGVLHKTIDSIIKQMHPCDHLIIKDGESNDQTIDIAKQFDNEINMTILSIPDTGIYAAWNQALVHNKNEWVTFVGAGDILADSYREEMSVLLDGSQKKLNFISHRGTLYLDDKRNGEPVLLRSIGHGYEERSFTRQMKIFHPGALHHHSLFHQDSFSTKYKVVSDYHFLLKNRHKLTSAFINKELVMMEASGVSNSGLAPFIEEFSMKRDINLRSTLILIVEFHYKTCKYLSFKLLDFLIHSYRSKIGS